MLNFLVALQEEVQLTSACVDLLTGIILIPLIILFSKLNTSDIKLKKMWLFFFICLSVGDILGFVFHFFLLDEIVNDLLWIAIYFFMYEIAKMFFKISLIYFGKPLSKTKEMIFDLVTLAFFVASNIIQFITINEIRLFVVFAIAIDIPAFIMFIYLALKKKLQVGYYMIIALIPQLVGFPFQLIKKGGFHLVFDFNHDGIYHICLLLSILIFILGAYKDIKSKKEGIINESICS